MDILPLFVSVIPFIAALYRVRFGIWLFVFMIPGYALRVPWELGERELEISMVEIAALLLLPVLFTNAKNVLSSLRAFIRDQKFLIVSIVLFVGGLLLSLAQSNDIFLSVGVIRGWVVVPIALFALLYLTRPVETGLRQALVGAFVFSGILVALISPFWDNAFSGGRLRGFYESPNYLAMYLSPLLPLMLFYAYYNWKNRLVRLFVLGGAGAVLIALFFSLSQGAWLGILGGGLLGAVIFGRVWIHRNWGTALFYVSVLGALITGASLSFGIFGPLLGAFHSRLGIWEAAWTMLSQSPLLGVGAGMFQTAFTVQKHIVLYPVPVEVALHPHNVFLAAWLYGGIMGLLGFFGILFWIGKNLYKRIKADKNAAFYGALAVSFAIILTHGLVDTTYWKNDLAFMWWMLMVLIVKRD